MKRLFLILATAVIAVTTAVSEPKKMAVSTFDIVNNAVTDEEAVIITELYIGELVSTGKVTVVDRNYFDRLIKEEMKFQASDWADKEKTLALGTAVGAEILAHGQIMKMGSKLYISVTVINGKTAVILSSGRKQFSNLDEIFDLMPQLAGDVVESLTLKIGDTGPGGGIVFYIEGNTYYETIVLGRGCFADAKELIKDYNDWHLITANECEILQTVINAGQVQINSMFWVDGYMKGDSSDGPYMRAIRSDMHPVSVNLYTDSYRWGEGNDKNTYDIRAVRVFSN